MFRLKVIAGILSVCGFLAWATGTMAEEPKPSPEAKAPVPPKGLRILNSGDSWHRFMPDYMARLGKAADIKDQSTRWSGKPDEIAELLVKGEIDVISWGRPGWSSGQLTEFLKQDVLENGLKANPNFRLYVQMAWMVHDGLGKSFQSKDDYDNSKIADVQAVIDRERVKVEAIADDLNKKHGRQVVFLVPLGDATTKLRAMIVEGKFPGVTKQSAIFSDAMPHAGPIAAELAAYCNYAAIYRTSPVGLQIKDGVPEEQRVILQKLAWEVVSKYPYSGVAVAQDPKSAPDKKLPAGLRVMSGGHSWSTENSAPLCQAAGITGHMKLNKQGLNSGRIEDLTPLLEKGEIDAYVWQNSLGAEFPKFLPTLVELGPKHNPNFRVLMQMPWLVHDGRQGVKSPEEYETTDLAEYQTKMDKYRKQQEAHVDEVNAKAGKRVVFLVPLGDGMLEVRKMIVAGKFPGVTKQWNSVLAGDHMPHQGLLGMRLGAYMHFAVLYRMSPEGLKFPGKESDGLTDDQRAILQKLAWDMVSKYPYAGIAKYEPSAPSKDEKKPAPTLAATTVPEALKGWKATQDLPDDTVVADYNAYIEKLPKEERPGVSDVKYYVDGTGRNAVAILVNVDDKQWTHLLVYDKQNKRTGVTKIAGK